MANKITSETVINPSGVFDISSCIVTETKSDLVISDCMTQITQYAFQFWIRSEANNYNVIFNCDTTSKVIAVNSEWQYFSIVFDVEQISNIILTFPKGKFYVYNTKLEVGSYPTDWSPHPEDGNQLIRELNGKVEQLLIQNTSTIDRMTNIVDKVNMTIENSMSRTEYTNSINGIMASINEDMENLKDGENKWYVTIYDKNDFNKLTKLPDKETDYSDLDEDEEDGNSDENTDNLNDEPDPSPEEPDDIDILEADDRERYDIKIFMMENGDINPLDEYAVNDNNIDMRIDGQGRVIYYYTFVKFAQDYKATLNCSFRKATCYLNGAQLISESIIDTMDVIFDFKAGWNLVEIVSNEGNFSFKRSISQMDECLRMNYAVAVPTSRSVKMQVKGSGIYQSLDRILSEVYKYELEPYTDENGEVKVRKVMKKSRIRQTADMIQLLVKDIYDNYSELSINPTFIRAITQKFEVVDPITRNKVIIQDGKLLSESIDSKFLTTDAIHSRNFDGGVIKQREVIDPDTGETVFEDYMDLDDIDFDPDNDRIFPAHGTFLELLKGNYYSPSLVVINEFEKQIEDNDAPGGYRLIDVTNKAYFKGDVYADVLTTNEGHIGPWNITETSLYRGVNALGQRAISDSLQGISYNSYMGDLGFSVGDAIVYDASTGSLTLRPNSLELSAPDVQAITSQAVNGNTIYYRQSGVPTTNNEPTIYWSAGETALHLNELCYRIDTGQLYRFEKIVNNEGDSVLYEINFSQNSRLRTGASSSIDYVEIYYRYGNPSTIYRVAKRFASSASFADPVVIPTDEFYVYLHIEDYSSSGLVDYYGFAIDSVTTTTGTARPEVTIIDNEKKRQITAQRRQDRSTGNVTLAINYNIPNYHPEELTVGVLPATEHPYLQNKRDKIWYVKSGVGNLSSYQWVEIENSELIEAAANARKALSYMHYDATNGLIIHNGLAQNMPDEAWSTSNLNALQNGNARFTTTGMDIYNGNKILASYGNTTEFYKYDTNNNRYTAASVGADGFSISDGKAGGINITFNTTTSEGAIYSNGHDTVSSTTNGFYLGSNGTFSVGGSNGMLTLNNGTLSLTFGGKTVQQLINESATGDTGASYFYVDSNGVHIYQDVDTRTNMPHILINGNNMSICKGDYLLAEYGSGINFFTPNSTQIGAIIREPTLTIDSNGVNIYSGSINLGIKNGNNNTYPYYFSVDSSGTFYSEKGLIGGIEIKNDGIYSTVKDSNNNPRFYIKSNGEFLFGNDDTTSYLKYLNGYLTCTDAILEDVTIRATANGQSCLDVKNTYDNNTIFSLSGSVKRNPLTSSYVGSNYEIEGRNARFGHVRSYQARSGQPRGSNPSDSDYATTNTHYLQTAFSAMDKDGDLTFVVGYNGGLRTSSSISIATIASDTTTSNTRFFADSYGTVTTGLYDARLSYYANGNNNTYSAFNIYGLNSDNAERRNLYITYDGSIYSGGSFALGTLSSTGSFTSTRFSVDANGDVYASGTVSQNSDERKKDIISHLNDGSYKELFMEIDSISYTWKNNDDERIHFGIGAQTLRNSIQKLGYSKLSLINDKDEDNLTANYTEILMLSVPVVQSHETEIQKLKSQIKSLQGEIKRLKGVM